MRAGGYLPTTPALWPPAPLWGGRDQSLLCYLSPSSDSLLICCKMPGLTACLTAPITVCLPSRLPDSTPFSLSVCHPVVKLAKALRQMRDYVSFYLTSTCLSACWTTWQTLFLNLIWSRLLLRRAALQWEWYYKGRALLYVEQAGTLVLHWEVVACECFFEHCASDIFYRVCFVILSMLSCINKITYGESMWENSMLYDF